MKHCKTCKHKDMSIIYLPCRICKGFSQWNMPTEYKELFVEELEEIKAEIELNITNKETLFKMGYDLALFKSIFIINNHISELKGENNEH